MKKSTLAVLFAFLSFFCHAQFTAPLAVVQGIDMPIRSGGGSVWSSFYLQDAKGYIAQNITFPSSGGSTYRFDISAKSSDYQGQTWANIQLKIDGVLKSEVLVASTSTRFYSFLVSNISAGTHQVQIASTNRVGPNTAGRLFVGMLYITQTTNTKPYVYPVITKQPFKLGQTLTALHYGSQVLRGFSLGGANLTWPDLQAMKSTGENIARYFIKVERVSGTNKYQYKAGEKAKSDSLIARAARLKFYVIPTFQIYPEGVNEDFWTKDATGAERRANIIALWKSFATQQANNAWIGAYDPINEPRNDRHYADWIAYLSKIIEGIRSVDPTHCILVEHSFSVEMFRIIQPLPYANLVYSPHGYPPLRITHQGVTGTGGTNYERVSYPVTTSTLTQAVFTKVELSNALAPLRAFTHQFNVPVFIGEFSCASWALNGTSTQWIADNITLLEAEKYAWGYHAFREAPAWDAELPYSIYKSCSFDSYGTPIISRDTYIASRTMSAPSMVLLKKYFALNTAGGPSVVMTSPSATVNLTGTPTVQLTASATDNSGTITKVEFYNGTTLLATEKLAPYSWAWSKVAAGSYSITAKAYNDNGLTATSAPVYINVAGSTSNLVANGQTNNAVAEDTTNNMVTHTLPLDAKPDFNLVPNPATRRVQVILNNTASGTGMLYIESMTGSVVKTISVNLTNRVIDVDLDGLAAGTYMLRLQTPTVTISKQLLKMK